MKKYILIILLAVSLSGVSAQKNRSILFSTDYLAIPSYSLHGAGYSLSYQQEVLNWFYWEGGTSFAMASRTEERNEIRNEIQLLDLNYHHASYSFYGLALAKLNRGKKLQLDLFAGPLASYHSNVFDANHYMVPEDNGSFSGHPNVTYSNVAEEGLLFGGMAGVRLSFHLGNDWSMYAASHVKAVFESKPAIHSGLGICYSW